MQAAKDLATSEEEVQEGPARHEVARHWIDAILAMHAGLAAALE